MILTFDTYAASQSETEGCSTFQKLNHYHFFPNILSFKVAGQLVLEKMLDLYTKHGQGGQFSYEIRFQMTHQFLRKQV